MSKTRRACALIDVVDGFNAVDSARCVVPRFWGFTVDADLDTVGVSEKVIGFCSVFIVNE
jgi:hypothetical protein